jgi:dTDP-4-dehydrorhamnose reductase
MVESTQVDMKWMITGASGQLGNCLIDELKGTDHGYVGLSRTQMDICLDDEIDYWLNYYDPDVVANVAAYTDVDNAELEPEKAVQVNSTAVGLLARKTHERGIKFLHFSTDYVFSGDTDVPWKTNSLTAPQSVYGCSKARGEQLALSMNPESLIIRTSWLYSKYSNNFLKKMISIALTEVRSIDVISDQIGQPTWARDVAELCVRAIEKKSIAGLIHASNSGEVSWYEYAKTIFEICGADPSRVQPIKSEEFLSRAKRPKYSAMDNSDWNEHHMSPLGPWRKSLENAIPEVLSSLGL